VLGERCPSGLGEIGGGAAEGVELHHQREGLPAHRLLNCRGLLQVVTGEDGLQALGPRLDVALPAGSAQHRPKPGRRQLRRGGRVRRHGEHRRASREARPAPLIWNAASAAGNTA
jgi:hypothetical protein